VLDLPDATLLDRRLAGLLAGAGALQALTLSLAHTRGTNPRPHPPRRGPYRHAAQVAEQASDW
jgi:hypothetical protein